MSINETATGPDSVAITGTASGEGSQGVLGKGDAVGVRGDGTTWHGVAGISTSTTGGAGVYGSGNPGAGVQGTSTKWIGVYGETAGIENGPAGVWGEHKGAGIGVKAISNTGVGLVAFSNGKAAIFQGIVEVTGNVEVTGDIRLTNADCAEDFDVVCMEKVELGNVMVIDSEGALRPSEQAYDKRVAGVVSGAGDYKPGLILDKQESSHNRMPIALIGKVYCKVDAQYGMIEVGDLLTTSATPGHAMKANDPIKAFGSVLGKALQPLKEGQGLIRILVSLQ
ncbi:hypothetical protein [Gloeocapsa sp. PCC 73106]|uniref:hypothetical protein n=1 Tax=Gloeocapsa sp. PCC 73106 TaxID=102232 RepID=UPI0002ACD053|nr:hypothetical protein [Gloeocapsa sp. PCC 73106]ELR96494.1 hypothetical protein GLO73106DRAFT_00002880 [Gloeocapsa sp. PCC 73106]